MKHCPNCGFPNDEGNAFCKQCGTPLKKTVPDRTPERGGPSGQSGKSGGANRSMKILVIVLALVAVIAIAAVVVLALRLEKPQPALPAAEQSSAEGGAAVEVRPIEQPQPDPPDVLPASGGDQPAAPAAETTPTPDPTPDPLPGRPCLRGRPAAGDGSGAGAQAVRAAAGAPLPPMIHGSSCRRRSCCTPRSRCRRSMCRAFTGRGSA